MRQALLALRSRFPNDPLSAVAAFHLGRSALDSGQVSEGVVWLQTSLQERPGGPLAREAMGRLLETLQRSGRREEAHALAEQYLLRFPVGPHAPLARSIVGD